MEASTTGRPGLVYIHGAGLDTWIWDDHLSYLDVPALAASYPGRGEPSGVDGDLGLADYADHVVQQIDRWSVDDVIVVGHSIGGVVGIEVAGARPDRLAGFAGLCAAIPEPGESFLSCLPVHRRVLQRILLRIAGTKPPDSVVRRSLGQGLPEAEAERIVDGYTPESRALYTDPVETTVPDVPTLYVKTADDPEFDPALQDEMIATLEPDAIATLETGHMPMLSEPSALAEILESFVEDHSTGA